MLSPDVRPGEDDESPTWDGQKWSAWIDEQWRARAAGFANLPKDIAAAYNRERHYSRDYHGREIFEMLQNADDANAVDRTECNVRIILTASWLLIANTGRPFSTGGIESLMTSDSSTKLRHRELYVGNRGLGFRSLLNWTNSPFVSSGNLSLAFDRTHAEAWLERLMAEHPAVKRVTTASRKGSELPVATFAIPFSLLRQETRETYFAQHQTAKEAWTVAAQLRADGYDTVIGVPFTSDRAFAEAAEQMSLFRPECLHASSVKPPTRPVVSRG